MRLGHRGRSEPAQTQPTRREHQQRNNTRHRGRLMRSISSPLPQTRKTFPPPQMGADRPQQHRGDRSGSRQHIRTADGRCEFRGQPRCHHHERQPATDQCGHQTRMPQPLRPRRLPALRSRSMSSPESVRASLAKPVTYRPPVNSAAPRQPPPASDRRRAVASTGVHRRPAATNWHSRPATSTTSPTPRQ
ncbi:Uncharacterised protein [Mycobacteroides abscessus]|nr:Uncharacterised protein [Mycobacteroides abscessus]